MSLRLHVTPGKLTGRPRLPGDRELADVSLVLGALADSPSTLRGLVPARHAGLIESLRDLGVRIDVTADAARVHGVGLRGLRMPSGALRADLPLGLSLLCGVLAAQPFGTRVLGGDGDRELPVRALVESLRARGAKVAGTCTASGGVVAPLAVAPLLDHERLSGAELSIPGGDAPTKAAMLLSGLYARGPTILAEGMLSSDSVERALRALDAPIETVGPMVMLDPTAGTPAWSGFDWELPADVPLSALLTAAALGTPESALALDRVSLNATRSGFWDALKGSGADVQLVARGETAGGEPWGVATVRASRLSGLRLGGELCFRCLETLPALCALLPAVRGRISVRDVPPYLARRLRPLSRLLRELGFESTAFEDGIDLDPGRGAGAATVDCQGDPWLTWVACIVSLSADHPTRLDDAAPVFRLYPWANGDFFGLGVRVERQECSED